MKSSGATVWWIDRENNIQWGRIPASRIYSGRTYESEVEYVIGADAKDYIIILDAREGDPVERDKLNRLKEKAKKMRSSSN